MTANKYDTIEKAMSCAKRLAAYKYMDKELVDELQGAEDSLLFDAVWSGMLSEYEMYISEHKHNVLTDGTAKSTYEFLVATQMFTVQHIDADVDAYEKKGLRFNVGERVELRKYDEDRKRAAAYRASNESNESTSEMSKTPISEMVYEIVRGRVTRLKASDKLCMDDGFNRTYVSKVSSESVVDFAKRLSRSYEGVVMSLSKESHKGSVNLELEIEIYHRNDLNERRWKGKSFSDSPCSVNLNDYDYKHLAGELSGMAER